MKILVLMGQRKCSYPGEYAPEALACINEYGHDENPEYLNDARKDELATNDFDSVEIITLSVPDAEIDRRLFPERAPVKADVV